MKTPIQEVYEKFHSMTDAGFATWMINAKLLEKEKEAIQQAFYEGMLCQGFDPNMGRAEMYYNEVYKNNE